MSEEIKIDKRDLSNLLVLSFRYCLGRRTYITATCEDLLKKYWHVLHEKDKEQIHGDIKRAIEGGGAGDKCDVESWKKVLELTNPNKGK